jgi:hypothetical protein
MALIECKECGKKIGRKAKNCPKCGSPNSANEMRVFRDNLLVFGFILAAVLIFGFFFA